MGLSRIGRGIPMQTATAAVTEEEGMFGLPRSNCAFVVAFSFGFLSMHCGSILPRAKELSVATRAVWMTFFFFTVLVRGFHDLPESHFDLGSTRCQWRATAIAWIRINF